MMTQRLPRRNSEAGNVGELISLHSSTCPEAIAIRDDKYAFTFGDLEVRSNQLAHFLRLQGIRTGDVVAVLMRRSVAFAAAALAVMKAGAAYLPIDPEYPRERIDYILQDSGAKMVLADTESRALIPAFIRSSMRGIARE